jgi:hypothetical protein
MIVYLSGPVKWAKVFDHNRDTGEYAPPGGNYAIDIGLTDEDFKEVKGWNRMYQGKKDAEDGLTYITFKRKHEHLNSDGEVIEDWSGAPKVVDAEAKDWDGSLIGNGSICTVKLVVNKVGAKTFVRLEGVRVDTHIPYVGKDGEEVVVENRSGGLPF